MTSPWSLRRRLGWLLGGVTVVAVALASVAIAAFIRVDSAVDRQVNRLDPANAAVLDFYGGMLDEEDGVRGYTLTGQLPFLQPYTDGLVEQTRGVDAAAARLVHEPKLHADLVRVQDAAAAWRQEYATPAIAQVRAGQPVSAELTATGKAAFDALRARFTELRDNLAAGRASSKSQLHAAITARWIAIGVALGLALVTCGLIVFGLRRWVTAPLVELASRARDVSAGDLTRTISVEGPAEIAALGEDLEIMRSRLQTQLAEAHRAADRIAEQAQSLGRSNAELEQFAYVASHDLQEPLRKVASFCQLLEQRYAEQLDDRARSYIGFAVDGAKRMQNLINDLLAFSRAGRSEAALGRVDLAQVLEQARSDLATVVGESGATITSARLPVVHGEVVLVGQLLTNLISNAIKFRGAQPPQVHLSCERAGPFWQICCADNGIGIDPQYADKIFLIFQRLHPKDVYAGTGIGLALCKKIVEYHGGRIWLDTGQRTGTRICFTLPAERTPQ